MKVNGKFVIIIIMFIERLLDMFDYLSPNYYFNKFSDVKPEFLKEENISTLLIDIDNTLAPYEQPEPDEKILTWLDSLKKNGINFAFISNNTSDARIKRFNKNIGAPAYANSKKPFAGKAINLALDELNAEKATTAFMGDQIYTDVCAGKFNGMRAILVPPIKDKRNLFFRFKRALEKPVLNYYFKKRGAI